MRGQGSLYSKRSMSAHIQSAQLIPGAMLPTFFRNRPTIMRPDANVEKVYPCPSRRL